MWRWWRSAYQSWIRKNHIREITHISGLPRSADGPEDENDQVLHLASVTIWCGNLVKEDHRSINRLEACEMWILRRVLQISCPEKVSKVKLFRCTGVEREILHIVKMRKAAFLGHILREIWSSEADHYLKNGSKNVESVENNTHGWGIFDSGPRSTTQKPGTYEESSKRRPWSLTHLVAFDTQRRAVWQSYD